ncbi:MAG: hypothetical protein IJH12_09430 [Clostridia bacterium]|nr:hypothetical protein [Clostridia bacterium]
MMDFFKGRKARANNVTAAATSTASATTTIAAPKAVTNTTHEAKTNTAPKVEPITMEASDLISVSEAYKSYVEKLFIAMLERLLVKGKCVLYDEYDGVRSRNVHAGAKGNDCFNEKPVFMMGLSLFGPFEMDVDEIKSDWTESRLRHLTVNFYKWSIIGGYSLVIKIPGLEIELCEETGWTFNEMKNLAIVAGLYVIFKIVKADVYAKTQYEVTMTSTDTFEAWQRTSTGKFNTNAHQLLFSDHDAEYTFVTRQKGNGINNRASWVVERRLPYSYNTLGVFKHGGGLLIELVEPACLR